MTDQFEPYARFYDLDYAGMDDDWPLIQGFAARCGSPILELACGTGRVLLPLAQEGHRVTGVDVSPAMLERARQKVTAQGLDERVTLVEQDMRHLDLDECYHLAFIVANSFLHMLTVEDQLSVLSGVRRHLQPGGLFLVDVFNPDLSRLLDAEGRVTLEKVMTDSETGRRIMKFHAQRADLGQQLVHITFIVDEVDAQGGVQRTLLPFSLRYLFRGELELLLWQAGFEVEAIYGSHELGQFSGDSERLIAVARTPD
jgi:SAM-dependent methyltransferase